MTLAPNLTYAQEAAAVDPMTLTATDDASGLVAIIMGVIVLVSSIAGIIFIFNGVLKLVNNAKNPNDPKNSLRAVFLSLLAGALLTNVVASASVFISTITGNGGLCFVQNDNLTGTVKLPTIENASCFDAETSEITEGFRDSLVQDGDEAWQEFKSRIQIAFGIVQVIGLFYFVKSIFLLKSAGEGQSDASYGKILIMMLFSSIAMDLDKAIEIIMNTISSLRGD